MQKFNSSNRIILMIILKVIFFSIICLIPLSLLFSVIIYKFDLDLDIVKPITYFILIVSSFFVPTFSLTTLKNNGFIMGCCSMIPILFYVIINSVVNHNSLISIIIKSILIIVISGLSGISSVKRNRRIKVK